MNVKALCVVGAAIGCASVASAQLQSSAANGVAGNPYIAPAGATVYSNPYDGISTFGNAAQVFEPTFTGYDIWLGDDFSTGADYTNLELTMVGFCGNGCVDPFNVQDFYGQIYDGLPNDANTNLVAESSSFSFNGIDSWTAEFNDECLPAGDYQFGVAARNDFGTNGQTYFFQQNGTQDVDNGWQWNPGGAFGFPGNLQFILDQAGVAPASPNAVMTGEESECDGDDCFADCNGDGQLSILDFVCYQGLFQSGDMAADCNGDGALSILDFVCFQGAFQEGCE